jgi:hypothetical protein
MANPWRRFSINLLQSPLDAKDMVPGHEGDP